MTFEGLDAGELERLTGAPRVVVEGRVPSALDTAHGLGAAGGPSGALVIAQEQTSGRGRHGRKWHSPPGTGLWLAMVLRPSQAPAGGALAIRAGLAVVEALRDAAGGMEAKVKWPNDVLLGGRKVGGVLCEGRWAGEHLAWVAVGIGLNVSGLMPPELAEGATSLAEAGFVVGRLDLLARLAPRIAALESAPSALSREERTRFLEVAVRDREEGVVEGIEPDGSLVVRRRDGELDRLTGQS